MIFIAGLMTLHTVIGLIVLGVILEFRAGRRSWVPRHA